MTSASPSTATGIGMGAPGTAFRLTSQEKDRITALLGRTGSSAGVGFGDVTSGDRTSPIAALTGGNGHTYTTTPNGINRGRSGSGHEKQSERDRDADVDSLQSFPSVAGQL